MRTSTMLKVPAGLIAAVLIVASLAPVAQAQDLEFAAKMNVPFAFETASGQHFGPGVYTVRMIGQWTMRIEGTETSGMAIAQLAYEGRPATQGKAVFTHYGDRYFLRTVWVAGNSRHLLCSSSKAERQSQIAAVKTPSTIEVSLLQEGR
jgi:hypothetical protein